MSGRWFARTGAGCNTFSSGSLLAFIEKARMGFHSKYSNRKQFFWINRRLSFPIGLDVGLDALEHFAVGKLSLTIGIREQKTWRFQSNNFVQTYTVFLGRDRGHVGYRCTRRLIGLGLHAVFGDRNDISLIFDSKTERSPLQAVRNKKIVSHLQALSLLSPL